MKDNGYPYSEVKVSPKHQVVIPKPVRKIVTRIKPGSRVLIAPLDEKSAILKVLPPTDKWVESTYGMDKEVWKGIDAAKYVRKLRNEWD